MQITQEKLYLVSEDAKDPAIILQVKVGKPADSYVMYDGKEHALFYHHENDMIVLDFLPENIRPILAKAEKIKIVETLSDAQTVIRNYKVPVKHVKDYPFDVAKYAKSVKSK